MHVGRVERRYGEQRDAVETDDLPSQRSRIQQSENNNSASWPMRDGQTAPDGGWREEAERDSSWEPDG